VLEELESGVEEVAVEDDVLLVRHRGGAHRDACGARSKQWRRLGLHYAALFNTGILFPRLCEQS
jgi:hypothetical protein